MQTSLLGSIPSLIAGVQPAAQSAVDAGSTRRGFALLSIVILLGVLLLACSGVMLILNVRRRARRRETPKKPAFATPDPWKESAARMSPAEYEADTEDRPHG